MSGSQFVRKENQKRGWENYFVNRWRNDRNKFLSFPNLWPSSRFGPQSPIFLHAKRTQVKGWENFSPQIAVIFPHLKLSDF